MIVCEEKFKKGDYIINRKCGGFQSGSGCETTHR